MKTLRWFAQWLEAQSLQGTAHFLIDLKTNKLSHQDLGQMQMYVNYYDRFVKQDFEKPTIGILLCESKNDALVELTLPQDSHGYRAQGEPRPPLHHRLSRTCVRQEIMRNEEPVTWLLFYDKITLKSAE